MTRTIREETHATFGYTGTWSTLGGSGFWGTTPTTPAASGTCKYSTVAGSVCTITLPITHGFTGCAIIGYGTSASGPDAVIRVDGAIVQAAWNQKFGTANDVNYYMPRILSQPITLDPAKGTTQVITITVGTNGLYCVIDGIELYVAQAAVAGRLMTFGHSVPYGVTSSTDGTPLTTTRFSKLFADTLSAQNYLGSSSWTDDSQCVPGEDLTNGSYWSGNSPAYPQFTNTRYWNQAAIQVPGWMRAECIDIGATGTHGVWPNPIPGVGPSVVPNFTTGTGSAARYYQGVEQWAGRLFAHGLIMHALNDAPYQIIYETGGYSIGGTNANTGFRDAASHTTAPNAGAGYLFAAWVQRVRDMCTRAWLNITPQPTIYLLGIANAANGTPSPQIPAAANYAAFDAAMAALCQETWIPAGKLRFIPVMAATTGANVGIAPGDGHLNAAIGHKAVHDAIRRAHDRFVNAAPGLGGGRL